MAGRRPLVGTTTSWLGEAPPVLRREAHFGDRVVDCFADRPASLHALLAEAVARRPGGEALVCGGERMTYAELDQAAGHLAAALVAQGVGAGERVALLVGNRNAFVTLLFAVARIGAIAVPMGLRLQAPEILHILTDCGAGLLVHEAELADRLPAPAEVPDLRTRVVIGGEAAGSLGFEAFSASGTGREVPPVAAVAEEDVAAILYTSGTTGRPKGAMLTHLGIVHSSMVYQHCLRLTEADRSIAAVPLSHVTGLIANITAIVRAAGCLIIMPAFKASDFLPLAARERMTFSVLVPAMYNLCLMQPDFAEHDLSAWRIGGYGGAPMPVPTIERLAERCPGLNLVNAYGSTETTSPSTILPPRFTASHGHTVGLAGPGVEILVMDDGGREVAPGETGEIWIRGPHVVKGYWNNPQATADGFTAGFWHSGDIGSMDAGGYVQVLDRKKDMINRGGYKVFTAEVETVLAGLAGVVECAVVAVPCPVLGERVHAYVVTQEEGAPDGPAIRAWCAQRLSDYKVPETLTVGTEPLLRNANGKVLKRVLREGLAA